MQHKIEFFKRNNGSEALIQKVGVHESGDYLVIWGFASDRPFRYPKYEFEKEFVAVSDQEVQSLQRQRCPRRGEGPGTFENEPLPDYWSPRQNGDLTCSFCGSLHPDHVISILETQGLSVISTTDKSYKWYINRKGIRNAMEGGIKYYRQHDTEEFLQKLLDLSRKEMPKTTAQTEPTTTVLPLEAESNAAEGGVDLTLVTFPMRPDASLILPDVKHSLDLYANNKCHPGSFLQAVLENDLMEAFGRADHAVMVNMPHILAYVQNNLPRDCWGSKMAVIEWLF